MVAAIDVGNGVGAILQHHANAAYTLCLPWIDATATVCDAADDREALADAIAHDAHGCVSDIAASAAIIARRSTIDGIAGVRVDPYFGQIGQKSRAAAR